MLASAYGFRLQCHAMTAMAAQTKFSRVKMAQTRRARNDCGTVPPVFLGATLPSVLHMST